MLRHIESLHSIFQRKVVHAVIRLNVQRYCSFADGRACLLIKIKARKGAGIQRTWGGAQLLGQREEKDLGRWSYDHAERMSLFDPDQTWKKIDDLDATAKKG